MEISEARKLKALEKENRELKKLLVETMPGASTLKEMLGKKIPTPSLRRRAMTWAINEKGYSQRRACRLVGLQPKTYRYAAARPDDGPLRTPLRELASQRRRFGCRRLGLLLARQGIRINRKKLYWLYKEGRLTVRKRCRRKRALGTRAPMTIPQDRNLRWSLHKLWARVKTDLSSCIRLFSSWQSLAELPRRQAAQPQINHRNPVNKERQSHAN
jgi:putative transposase